MVTGAGSGIGRASAVTFSKRGASVAVIDVDEAGGLATAKQIEESGGRAVYVQADVSVARQVQAAVEKIIGLYGRLDFAHNNAGIQEPAAKTADLSEDDWDRVLDVNLKGIWLCMKHEIPRMLERGGVIVNTASTASIVGVAERSAYTASKHGILGLTKAAALDYARDNIRINAICPGFTLTPLAREYLRKNPNVEADLLAKIPMGRGCSPEEIAEVVVWLCSDAASYLQGSSISVDGGITIT